MENDSFKKGEVPDIELLKGNLRYRESTNASESPQKTGFSEPECDPNAKKKPSSRTPEGKIKPRCGECQPEGMGAIRNCTCYECPLWAYRPNKTKLEKSPGWLDPGSLTVSDRSEVEEKQQAIAEAQERVLALAKEHCLQKYGYFVRAFSGKSRVAALRAEQLYLANYDKDMVEEDHE